MVDSVLRLAVAGDLAARGTDARVSGERVVLLHQTRGEVDVVDVALVREEELDVVLLHSSQRAGGEVAGPTVHTLHNIPPQPLLIHLQQASCSRLNSLATWHPSPCSHTQQKV